MTHGYGAMPDYSAQLTPEDRRAVAAYIRALQLSQAATAADVPTGAQVQDLKGIATSEGHPEYAQPWALPATAVQAYPQIAQDGTPGMAPANPADPAIKIPASKPAAPAAAKPAPARAMRTRTPKETAIICGAAVLALALVMIPFELSPNRAAGSTNQLTVLVIVPGVIVLAIVLGYRYLTSRRNVQVQLTGHEQYRQLADEYRRLADMAITAQEHTDLKLGDVSAQLDYLREQNESLQKILKEVE